MLDGTPVTTLRRDGDAMDRQRRHRGAGRRRRRRALLSRRHGTCGAARTRRARSSRKKRSSGWTAHERDRVSDAPELFFCRDLEGYGWCVRKGEYLNVGIGRRESRDFARHVKDFVAYLQSSARAHPTLRGRMARARVSRVRRRAAAAHCATACCSSGDAAGLAYPESGEGIRPAIESGHLAAQTLIAANGRLRPVDALQPYADAIRRLHPPAPVSSPSRFRAAVAAIGRMLLGSPTFTRRVVLDRWFLRA